MNSQTSSPELVRRAYCLLKQDTYYNNMDLFLREKLAAYETDEAFEERQRQLAAVIDDFWKEKSSKETEECLGRWLGEVSFRLLPKSVVQPKSAVLPGTQDKAETDGKNQPRLISNMRTAEQYEFAPQGGVQHFFYAPIELYILSTLWCISVGRLLDRQLDDGCFGNRLEGDPDGDEEPSRLFKIYHFQYAQWRDTAITRAEALLDQGSSSVLVSLDIKQCYYHLSVDWKKIPRPQDKALSNLARNLTDALRRIHAAYHEAIAPSLKGTHDQNKGTHDQKVAEIEGIPVGLPSSRVLANWLLKPFDNQVRETLRPAYYGRYVDDMLIVAQAPPKKVISAGINEILKDLLINRGLLTVSQKAEGEYNIPSLPGLVIQSSKLIVQHFDKNHSRAGLREFIKQIKREASDFRFLPADERGRELDACAYDLIYEGSINKLRSLIGITENSTEMSKYLRRRMVEHRLTSEALQKNVAEQLDRFTRGKNLLDFCTTWERILTLLIVKKQHQKAADMLRRCLDTVDKLSASTDDAEWVGIARKHLKEYLTIALAMPLALLDQGEQDEIRGKIHSKRLQSVINADLPDTLSIAVRLRKSNLMRHNWVAWPLLNFTGYRGSLVVLDMDKLAALKDWSIKDAESLSPRHIHADEHQLFRLLQRMFHSDEPAETFFFDKPKSLTPDDEEDKPDIEWSTNADDKSPTDPLPDPLIATVNIPSQSETGKLAIGIANLRVSKRDIAASYEPLRTPNMSWARQAKLFHLLNLAERENCDIVVLPEVSVPYLWLPFMVAHARRAKTALVFGLEHWVSGKTAYNLLVTILPCRENGRYRACRIFIRPKNHYSPGEIRELDRLGYSPPDLHPSYFLFNWRGAIFTVFNCYELSNIRHRSVFRGKIDLLIGAEWNRDTKYFSNIVESTVRDLHCYMVQVNTSDFGDSRVTSPKKSEEMNVVRVSGGLNTTLLKAEIDISDLNDFRSKKPSPIDTRYKPTPAGFEHEDIRKRSKHKGSAT